MVAVGYFHTDSPLDLPRFPPHSRNPHKSHWRFPLTLLTNFPAPPHWWKHTLHTSLGNVLSEKDYKKIVNHSNLALSREGERGNYFYLCGLAWDSSISTCFSTNSERSLKQFGFLRQIRDRSWKVMLAELSRLTWPTIVWKRREIENTKICHLATPGCATTG